MVWPLHSTYGKLFTILRWGYYSSEDIGAHFFSVYSTWRSKHSPSFLDKATIFPYNLLVWPSLELESVCFWDLPHNLFGTGMVGFDWTLAHWLSQILQVVPSQGCQVWRWPTPWAPPDYGTSWCRTSPTQPLLARIHNVSSRTLDCPHYCVYTVWNRNLSLLHVDLDISCYCLQTNSSVIHGC